MEEGKKVVHMEPSNKSEKLTYEQLENVARQLSEQNQMLIRRVQETNMGNVFKRLDYLFKVVGQDTKFNKEFVEKCISEIESIMVLSEEENTED